MRILFVDTYYARFLDRFYARSGLRSASYDDQIAALLAAGFGTSDFYSTAARALGHEAIDVVANATPAQVRWASENGVRIEGRSALASLLGGANSIATSVLRAQIAAARPDVVYVQAIDAVSPVVAREAAANGAVVVGQLAARLPARTDIGAYHAIFSAVPHLVDWLSGLGVPAHHVPLAFDARMLTHDARTLTHDERRLTRDHDAVFAGTIGAADVYGSAARTLEDVAAALGDRFALYSPDRPPPGSALARAHRGEVWGRDMLALLGRTRVALNRHGAVALQSAANMRLFEATGMGALLLTDAKPDLHTLFQPDVEVVTYASAAECADKARYLLDNEPARAQIAAAGQARTLRDHTYRARVAAMLPILTTLVEQRATRRALTTIRPLSLSARLRRRARAALPLLRATPLLAPSHDEELFALHAGAPPRRLQLLAEAVSEALEVARDCRGSTGARVLELGRALDVEVWRALVPGVAAGSVRIARAPSALTGDGNVASAPTSTGQCDVVVALDDLAGAVDDATIASHLDPLARAGDQAACAAVIVRSARAPFTPPPAWRVTSSREHGGFVVRLLARAPPSAAR